MKNTEKGYTGRNIYILSGSQAAIKALWQFPDKSQIILGLPSTPGETGRTWQDPTGIGARTQGNWWKWNSWSVSQKRFLTYTHRTWACTWYICEGCWEWSGTG
jgi:hypothetical protein